MNAHSRFPSVQKTGGRLRPGSHLERLLVGHFLSAHQFGGVEKILRQHYPDDALTPALVTRAGVTPTSLANATAVQQEAVADYVTTLAPLSAGAKLLQSAVRVDLARNSEITIPGKVVTAADGGSFVVEGEAIPVLQPALTSVTLAPRKLASIGVFSNELSKRSLPSIESVVSSVMREGTALALDQALLNTTAASTARPAGIFNGIAALTPSADTDPFSAFVEDLRALYGAVPAAGGGQSVVIVAAPQQAAFLGLLAPQQTAIAAPVLVSNALAAGTIAIIETSALAVGFGLEPRIEASKHATLHMETAPSAIVSGGAVPAGAVRSLYQTDTTALRLVLDVSWGLRAPQLAWMQSVLW
jgi:hypothetical protein